ncbi:hypothetical protein OSTOST_13269, partial [Ostertagia ostertagi]
MGLLCSRSPVIGYMAASNSLSDKKAYPTLARVSLRTTSSLAEATSALLNHYGWTKVCSNAKIIFDEWADTKAMVASGLLSELKVSARIVICLFSNTRESSRHFLTAANSQGMSVNEFAYVLPWLQDGTKESSPWISADGSMLQKVKDQYANAII